MAVNVGLGLIGFIVGNLFLSRIGAWATTIQSIILETTTDSSDKVAKATTATLLSSGPWFVVITIVAAYYYRGSPRALAFILGVIAATLLFSPLAVYVRMRQSRKPLWVPEQLPGFVRFALWAGPRKKSFIVAHAIAAGGLLLAYLAVTIPLSSPLIGWLLMAVDGFVGGALMGWFNYQMYVWPTYAAFPKKALPLSSFSDEWPHPDNETPK